MPMTVENGVLISAADETDAVIPAGVTTIGRGAFFHCGTLTSVSFPESVTEIGELAFGECHNLTAVTLPESLEILGFCAFTDCDQIKAVTFPESLKEIGDYPFEKTTVLHLPSSVGQITVAPRKKYDYHDDIEALFAVLQHTADARADAEVLFENDLKTFEYKAAAATFLIQLGGSAAAAAFLRRGFKRIASDYTDLRDAHMMRLLLGAQCHSPAQQNTAAQYAKATGQTEICALLEHKQ